MEELSTPYGHKPQPMSEETKNIGSTYKMQCEYDIYVNKYVTGKFQSDILTVTVVVFFKVPASKFKNEDSRMSFGTSIFQQRPPSKPGKGYRVEISMV